MTSILALLNYFNFIFVICMKSWNNPWKRMSENWVNHFGNIIKYCCLCPTWCFFKHFFKKVFYNKGPVFLAAPKIVSFITAGNWEKGHHFWCISHKYFAILILSELYDWFVILHCFLNKTSTNFLFTAASCGNRVSSKNVHPNNAPCTT